MLDLKTLNQAIISLAPLHHARGIAPSTFADIMQAPGIVWEGASDQTIFQGAKVNHAFRAWHDARHISGQHDFTLAGERATCEAQKRDVALLYPSAPAWVYRLLDAEIVEQGEYFVRMGAFPLDQVQFTMERLNHV